MYTHVCLYISHTHMYTYHTHVADVHTIKGIHSFIHSFIIHPFTQVISNYCTPPSARLWNGTGTAALQVGHGISAGTVGLPSRPSC